MRRSPRATCLPVLGTFDPAIVWNEAEGYRFAAGNPYAGPQTILKNVLVPLAMQLEGFKVTPSQVNMNGSSKTGRLDDSGVTGEGPPPPPAG